MTQHPTPDPVEQLAAQIQALAHTATEVWPHVAAVLFYLRAAMTEPEAMDELRKIIAQLARARVLERLDRGDLT